MKRLVKDSIFARTEIQEKKFIFTIKNIIDLLSEMRELENYDISYKMTRNGSYNIKVGSSNYALANTSQYIFGNEWFYRLIMQNHCNQPTNTPCFNCISMLYKITMLKWSHEKSRWSLWFQRLSLHLLLYYFLKKW